MRERDDKCKRREIKTNPNHSNTEKQMHMHCHTDADGCYVNIYADAKLKLFQEAFLQLQSLAWAVEKKKIKFVPRVPSLHLSTFGTEIHLIKTDHGVLEASLQREGFEHGGLLANYHTGRCA